jgi:hypothetical protein
LARNSRFASDNSYTAKPVPFRDRKPLTVCQKSSIVRVLLRNEGVYDLHLISRVFAQR